MYPILKLALFTVRQEMQQLASIVIEWWKCGQTSTVAFR